MLRNALLALLVSVTAAKAATGTITITDGAGIAHQVPVELNGGNMTLHSVPEVAGAAVTNGNPLPGAIVNPLPIGTNAIGTVGVTALPALPAGSAAIGTVGVTALPPLPAGNNIIGQTTSANPATILTNQVPIVPIVTTGTAVSLGSGALTNGIIITAPSSNKQTLCVGNSNVTTTSNGTGNGYCLTPGTSTSFGVTNLSAIFIKGTSGDWVQYAGN